jgi:Met-zincin/Domain of unknown function (DUF5117)
MANRDRIGMCALLVAACGMVAGVAMGDDGAKDPSQIAAPGPGGPGAPAEGGDDGDESGAPKLKPWAEVSKGYEQVQSVDGKSFMGLWVRKRDGAMLAEMPAGWAGQKHFFAMTTPTGDSYAGLQAGDIYVYWKRVENRMLLIEPNLGVRSTGDQESKRAIKDIFTDRVILDVAVVTTGPGGQPVIDLKELLVGRAREFYGLAVAGANPRLATLVKAKAFPENVEITWEMPGEGGRLQQFHYSISLIPENTGYKPRVADERVGYFTTVYRDLGKFRDDEKWIRYVNRWRLEKRDPDRKLSPPKDPIVYYIESTTPVRYRRYVREGILSWNKAFEKVGILDAIEVRQQDAESGSYMDIDPEDVRYNFVRWLANDMGTAIGPSRVHPLTGQILDADVVLTDGWIRHFWFEFGEVMPELAMEGFSPETMAWLDQNPQWDPRVRLADPAKRNFMIAQRANAGVAPYGGHPMGVLDPEVQKSKGESRLIGREEFDGMVGRTCQVQGLCRLAHGKALDMGIMRLALDMVTAEEMMEFAPEDEGGGDKKDEKKGEKKEPKWDTIDGVPDWFVGPALIELTAHEVGHTLGLRHNFKASSIYTWNQINSDEVKGKKPWSSSVMDYCPTNFYVKDGKPQGDFHSEGLGAYDFWAIEFGYTSEDTKEVLKRVAEPELVYATDEDTSGPDPLARRYDMGANTIDYGNSQMELARYHRGRLLEKFVKDGQSWSRVRKGYTITLGMQTRSLSMIARWVGGAYVNRDRKGDPNARSPVQVVAPAQQRAALKWCIDNAFYDAAFGLTPELLEKMTVDKWMDEGGWQDTMTDATFPVHDRIAGIQTSTLTMLMNPSTLRRVYDNEFRTPAGEDALTLPELMTTVSDSIWSELEDGPGGRVTARKPYISSLRRGLQAEHMARMIDLMFSKSISGEAAKPISNLAAVQLRAIGDKIGKRVDKGADGLDPYSFAHLSQAKAKIAKALEAQYTYPSTGGGGGAGLFGGFHVVPKTNSGDSSAK